MLDVLTPQQRHECMSHIRSKNTKPELLVRYFLWHRGFRYRLHAKNLPGKPDIVLPKYRTVIFIHGCFWHGHKDCKNASMPKTDTDFWTAKITGNQERDQNVWRQLEAQGWAVIIVWECQLKRPILEETITRVVTEILRNGEQYYQALEMRKASRKIYREIRLAHKEHEAVFHASGEHCNNQPLI